MHFLLYNIFIKIYPLIIKLSAPFNQKANSWVEGRKLWKKKLSTIENLKGCVWMHCASLGEFEQGRPLLEKLKEQYPQRKILLTFFSPSGYNVQKNYSAADVVMLLPMDSLSNADFFLQKTQPSLVIFIKYEFWYYYLKNIAKRSIPLLLVSGIFRKDQPFFKWHGRFYKNMLAYFTHLFVQDEHSQQLLASIQICEATISGDTRFDRVKAVAEAFEPLPLIEQFTGDKPTIVAGSTWPEDDKALSAYANTNNHYKYIIAPHDISDRRIKECLLLYNNAVLFSKIDTTSTKINFSTLIVDNVGMLSRLYYYATLAYVGGGFRKDGVHNLLEAAVFNKPIVIGPEFKKYKEAIDLVNLKGASTVSNVTELTIIFQQLLNNSVQLQYQGKIAGDYVKNNTGAIQKIIQYIQENRLLIN